MTPFESCMDLLPVTQLTQSILLDEVSLICWVSDAAVSRESRSKWTAF